jgi:hypothetical protein
MALRKSPLNHVGQKECVDMDQENVSQLLAEDHADVGGLFRQLLQALEAGDARLAFSLLDFLWARLAVHIRAENLCLFPTILRAADQLKGVDSTTAAPRLEEARSAISELRIDHDFFMRELAEAVNRMRAQEFDHPDGFPPEQLAAIRQIVEAVRVRLESHNRLEEEKVYRWPAHLLNVEERERLVNDMKLEIENLPPRFNTSSDAGEGN